MVKVIMTWNIREGKESEYLDFLNREFVKAIMDMGIQPTDAWYAVWGHGPQVVAGGVADDLEAMDRALSSEEWKKFQEKLQEFVVNLKVKVVEASGGFQL
jgi:hypothetical protein